MGFGPRSCRRTGDCRQAGQPLCRHRNGAERRALQQAGRYGRAEVGGVVGEHCICILTAIAIKVLAFAFHVVQGQDWQQDSVRGMYDHDYEA
jgi:hypothetical protein